MNPTKIYKAGSPRLQAQISHTHTHTHTPHTHTHTHRHVLLNAMAVKQKQKCRHVAAAHTKEPSLTECFMYLTRTPNGPRVTKKVAVHNVLSRDNEKYVHTVEAM